MSQKSGHPSRTQQVHYTRQSLNPVPSNNMAQGHESGYEEGRQPRVVADSGLHDVGDCVVDAPCNNAAKRVCDAAERGPRKAGDGAGLTYLCIEVLDSGGGGGSTGGNRGGGVGVGSGGVDGRGSDGGYTVPGDKVGWGDPQGSLPVATPDTHPNAPWPSVVSPVPEVAISPNWPSGSPGSPWQTFPPTRDWPILDARMWSKYHYPPGRAEFAHAWCSQLSQAQIDQTSPNREIPQQHLVSNVNSSFSQPLMWNPEIYESWRSLNSGSANKAYSRGKIEGPVHDQKDSVIDSLEPTLDDAPKKSFEALDSTPTQQEDTTRTMRGVKIDKAVRCSSKGIKRHSTHCKASLSTPLLPPVGQSPDTRNSPLHVPNSRHESSIHRVLSDESFVRGPTTTYYSRRMHKMSGNDKRSIDTGNLDNIKPAKMIKPPKPIKPVKCVRIMKSGKSEAQVDVPQDVPIGRDTTPQNGKVNKLHRVIPNKLNTSINQEPDIVPKVGTPAPNSIRSSLRATLPKRHLNSQRGISPTKGVTNVHIVPRPATEYRDIRTEKYTRNKAPSSATFNVRDRFETDDRMEPITTVKQNSEKGINLVDKTSFESFQYEEILRPIERMKSHSHTRRADMFNTEEPVKCYSIFRNDQEGTLPSKDSTSALSHRVETTFKRQETENKVPVETSMRYRIASNAPSWHFEHHPSSKVPGPKRSATESTFRVPNLRSKYNFQQVNCRKDAAVSTGPRLCVISTQTDNEDELEIGASESYGIYSRFRPSTKLGNKRPERFASDVSGMTAPTDPRNSSFFNPYHQDQYLPYRATLPIGNLDILNPMYYGGFLPDGSSRDHVCNPCIACPNSPQRAPFWSPGSPFPGYGMPMSMHMPMPMCMAMPMPMTCSCESCGSLDRSAEMRRHVDVVDVGVGDSHEDKSRSHSRERTKSNCEEERNISKYIQEQSSDSENEETNLPSARKRIELLLAGLTPKGKTLHPERLNILLQDISPDIVKKIIEETSAKNNDEDADEGKCYERSKTKQEGCNNKLRELINALSIPSENELKDVDEPGTDSDIQTHENDRVEEINDIRCNEDFESITNKRSKNIVNNEVSCEKFQEKEREDNKEKTALKKEAPEKQEEMGNIVQNKVDEKERAESNKNKLNKDELKEDIKNTTITTQMLISESGAKKITEKVKTVKINSDNKIAEKVEADKEQNQTERNNLFRPIGESSVHIKIRTRPLFRNQNTRENHTTAEQDVRPRLQRESTTITSTDTGSSTTSLNPATSVSDMTTVEATHTQESIISLDGSPSPLVLQEHTVSTRALNKDPKCIERNPSKLEETSKPVCQEEIKKATAQVDRSLQIQNKLEVPKQLESKTEKEPQCMEKRYSICPCPAVTLTLSKPSPYGTMEQVTQVSRPTSPSPSRPVTVSPLRPLPRPVPPPRKQPASLLPLQRANARRRRTNSENVTSAGNLHSTPRSGTIRPPRARVPQRLLQATLATGDSDGKGEGARKSCNWSRLSFVERTELARALVDSATCTVKVGDATVLLARSELTSLMTIAEGILHQSRPTTKPYTNIDRKSRKSTTGSPVRSSRSSSSPVVNPEKKKSDASELTKESFKNKFSKNGYKFQLHNQANGIPSQEYPDKTRATSPAKQSSVGSKTSISKKDTKLGFTNSLLHPPRAFSKGFIGKAGRYGLGKSVDRSEENFHDHDCSRQVPKAGRYCSMRTNGPLKKPSSPPLIPPPRGFRGHGRSSHLLNLTRKNENFIADAIRNPHNFNENSFKRRINYSEKYENFRKYNSKITDFKETKGKCFGNKRFTEGTEGDKIKSIQDEQKYDSLQATRNSPNTRLSVQSCNYYGDKMKSKKTMEDSVNFFHDNTKKLSHSDTHEMFTDLEDEILYFKHLRKKCKSLVLVNTLLSEASISHLRKSLWRSISTPSIRVNNPMSSTLLNTHHPRNTHCCNHNGTRSGNNLYQPSEHTGSRVTFRQQNQNETKKFGLSGLRSETGMSKSSFGCAHPDCCFWATTTSYRSACPSNSAPGAKMVASSGDTSRIRAYADDFYVLHPPRHTLQPGRPSRPRLPVTAVAAAQRVAPRSQSYGSFTRATPQHVDECGSASKVTTARSTLQVQRVPTPPTPWRDE